MIEAELCQQLNFVSKPFSCSVITHQKLFNILLLTQLSQEMPPFLVLPGHVLFDALSYSKHLTPSEKKEKQKNKKTKQNKKTNKPTKTTTKKLLV